MVEKKWVTLASMGIMGVVTLFALLSLFTAWAYEGDADIRATEYEFQGISTVMGENKGTISMGSESLDDADGVGMARASGVLAVVAVCMFVAGLLAFENQWLTGKAWLGLLGLSTAALGTVLWILTLIMFPIAINGLADSYSGGFGGTDLKWGAGLVFGILAGVFAVGSVALSTAQRLIESGFRLEMADDGPANFD